MSFIAVPLTVSAVTACIAVLQQQRIHKKRQYCERITQFDRGLVQFCLVVTAALLIGSLSTWLLY